LDPDLQDAYHAGSIFLSEPEPVGAGQPQEAIQLLDRGIRTHPREWRMLHDKGFIYYWYLKDYKMAGEVWRDTSRLKDAPHWMEPLSAMSLSKGGAIEIAIALWQQQFRDSNRADVRENAKNHLLSFDVARDIWSLEYLIEKYRAKNGSFPGGLEELVRGKEGKYRVADPLGFPYQYNPVTGEVSLSPQSKIRYIKVPETYKPQLLQPANAD